jgi:hypothetical protein
MSMGLSENVDFLDYFLGVHRDRNALSRTTATVRQVKMAVRLTIAAPVPIADLQILILYIISEDNPEFFNRQGIYFRAPIFFSEGGIYSRQADIPYSSLPGGGFLPAHSLDAETQIPYSSSAFPEIHGVAPGDRRTRKQVGIF